MVVNKKTGAGGSPGGYQGVKPGAGRLPLLIDRDQLLAPGRSQAPHFPSNKVRPRYQIGPKEIGQRDGF